MNIYVSNLDYGIRDQQLQELFEQFGEVSSAKVITDRDTGRSKGFGFVEMSNDDEAQNSIDALNGSDVNGRAISVVKARPPQPRSDFGGGGGGGPRRQGGGGFNRGGGGGNDRYNKRY